MHFRLVMDTRPLTDGYLSSDLISGAAVIAVAIAGGNVAVGLAVGRPTEHPAEPIVLVSIVTAPFQASARAGHASAGGQADAPEREEGDDSRLY